MDKLTKCFLFFVLIVGCVLHCPSAQIHVFQNENRFPIMGYHSFEVHSMATDSNFQIFKEAGFNIAVTSRDGESSTSYNDSVLSICQQLGIKTFFSIHRSVFANQNTLNSRIRNWTDHPACAGIMMYDEPNVSVFNQLSVAQDSFYETVDRIGRHNRDQLCYINLFPTFASNTQLGIDSYENYLTRYIRSVNPKFLSFDHYGVRSQFPGDSIQIFLRPDYYKNLELISKAAREAGIPFWSFVLSSSHGVYPTPTMGQLKLQAFSGIAYGAQCIQYYGYAADTTRNDTHFENVPFNIDGTKSQSWYLIKELNELIQFYCPYILGMEVLNVWHTGSPVLVGTTAVSNIYGHTNKIFNVRSEGIGIVISYFTNNGRYGLMLVNKDFVNSQIVRVQYYGDINLINAPSYIIENDGQELQQEEIDSSENDTNISYPYPRTLHMTIEPGDCKIVTWGNAGDREIF